MLQKNILLLILFISSTSTWAQKYTRADSLQGDLRLERTAYDVLRYDLEVQVSPKTRSIIGVNNIHFKIVEKNIKTLQLDLFENMTIDSIIWNRQKLTYFREFNAVFLLFPQPLEKESLHNIHFYYSGHPETAQRPPWDGGFVWDKDINKNDWIGVAVQGKGASTWYPVKDHQSDEPDQGATISITTPQHLMGVSNGRLIEKKVLSEEFVQWKWKVTYPINNYNITLNIGDYAHLSENYKGLDIDYYVLKSNLEKAKKHFKEVKPMLDCFQEKFGKYPFWEDGYKLVETPYLGMEHQSAIAYGNQYQKGYLGQDISGTGIGLLFDYITIHESGHEWFGNSITSRDIADMWIHEGFTTYCEGIFIECQFGYDQSVKYMNGKRKNILNKAPIIGQFGVNFKATNSDMYSKGALLLHTLRSVINEDKLWWDLLLSYSEKFKYQIIDTPTVVAFFNEKSGMDLTPIFNQYLKYKDLPILEIKQKRGKVRYRWKVNVPDFEMPIEVTYNNKIYRLKGTTNWKKSAIKTKDLSSISLVDQRFYVILEKQK